MFSQRAKGKDTRPEVIISEIVNQQTFEPVGVKGGLSL